MKQNDTSRTAGAARNVSECYCRTITIPLNETKGNDLTVISRAVGITIKRMRAARHWSQEELATKSGVSRSTIAQVETAFRDRNISEINLAKIAEALGTTVDVVLGLAEPTQPNNNGASQLRNWIRSPLELPAPTGKPTEIQIPIWSLGSDTMGACITIPDDLLPLDFEHAPHALKHRGWEMAPTVSDGDILLIDPEVSTCDLAGLYLLRVGNDIRLRRLTPQVDGQIRVSVDSTVYREDQAFAAERLQIMAQVVSVIHCMRVR